MPTEGPPLNINIEVPPTAIEGPLLPTEGLPGPREWPPLATKEGLLLPTEGLAKHSLPMPKLSLLCPQRGLLYPQRSLQ